MPHDDMVLAELGAIVGRLERDVRLQTQTCIAEAHEAVAALRQERAEARLELAQAAHDLATEVAARLAEVRNGEPGPPGADSAVPGPPGADGRSFTGRRTYSETETYRALDVVALDGSSFFALRDEPGPCPGDGWQLMSPRGRAGQPGQRGEKGDRGSVGPAGPPGPGIKSLGLDEDGVLTLTLDDGSAISCDFYPLLAKLR